MNNNPAVVSETSGVFPRNVLEKIKPFLNSREIIAVVGPRQAGKTTVLKVLFNNLQPSRKCLFLTFESLLDREIFDDDIENFKKLYCLPYEVVFIDEFQYGRDAGQKLKYLFDTTGTKFIVSGSSSLEIKQTGRYLVGRVLTFNLYSLSFSEFLKVKNGALWGLLEPVHKKIAELFAGNPRTTLTDPIKSRRLKTTLVDWFYQYLVYGGYPRVVAAGEKEDRKIILGSIVDNYLLREIKSLLHLATENQLLLLAKFLSLSAGNLVSYNELSNSTGLSFDEVKKHINILEETFILKRIYPYYRNRRTELVKTPKVYFTDFGFRNRIIDNFLLPAQRPDMGALAENFMFNWWHNHVLGRPPARFWRTKSQAEVDLVIESGGSLIPIEVKYSAAANKTIGKSLYSFINKYSPEAAVVTTNDIIGFRQVDKTRVWFVPVFYFG